MRFSTLCPNELIPSLNQKCWDDGQVADKKAAQKFDALKDRLTHTTVRLLIYITVG